MRLVSVTSIASYLWTGSANDTLANAGLMAMTAGLIGVALLGFVRMYWTAPQALAVADRSYAAIGQFATSSSTRGIRRSIQRTPRLVCGRISRSIPTTNSRMYESFAFGSIVSTPAIAKWFVTPP